MKIAAVSDTHLRHPELPEGDIFLHCGDFTFNGLRAKNETPQVCEWFNP